MTPDSRGYFILGVTQPRVDTVLPPQALVACSADGRVAVRVWADRNITVAMGPSPEGKTHHVTMEGHLNGRVISTIDTYTGLPCAPQPATAAPPAAPDTAVPFVAPFVIHQAARADGSLVHVVRAGDTLHGIAFAYGLELREILERNQLESGGYWIFPGQEIIIRDAPVD